MPALLPSELPIRCRARPHWIVLLTPPGKWWLLAAAVLLVVAIFDPNPFAWILAVLAVVIGLFRWRTWRAERIILTGKRIIRLNGIPETTSTELSLRIDRVSGAKIVETVPGKLLGFGTIELEAPGEHPGVRSLKRISNPNEFYLAIRAVIFGEPENFATDAFGDPDGPARGPAAYDRPAQPYGGTVRYPVPGPYDTAPLPRVPARPRRPPGPPQPAGRHRFGRRR